MSYTRPEGVVAVRRYRWTPWLLAMTMLMAAGFAVAQPFAPDPDGMPMGFPLYLTGIAAAVGLSPFARAPFFAPDPSAGYDEFEAAAVHRATLRAYALITLLVALFCCWGWLAARNGWPLPRRPVDWAAAGLAFLTVAANLPAFIAEIAVPFPDEEPA